MSTAVYLPVTIGRGAGFHSAPFQNPAWPDADMRAGIPTDRNAATHIRSNSASLAICCCQISETDLYATTGGKNSFSK